MNSRPPSSASGEKASLPVVVVIGGGFGGLSAVRALKGAPARILLLDRSNHHLFQPLLYQVATAGLSPADIAKPIRSIVREQENVTVILSEVKEIRPDERTVVTADGPISYDYLIVATGARHSYFGHDEWERFAPGLKSLHDAVDIRRRVLTAFEQAEKTQDGELRRAFMTFVVVGAGPTGVEMAGAISELARWTLARDFRNINPQQTRVLLVEAGPRVLPAYTEALSESAKRQLEQKLHVEVRVGDPVEMVDAEGVTLKSGRIPARTVVWAAGNRASPLAAQLGCELNRAGCVMVSQDLSIPGHPEIQAIGDMVAIKDKAGRPVPGVAPAAMQMGEHAAKNILRSLRGEPAKDFWYFDKGSLATIGRHAGVADLKGLRFSGWPAWLAWAFIHLYFLIGFRNRVFVFFQWAWAYFAYSRGARLISEPPAEK